MKKITTSQLRAFIKDRNYTLLNVLPEEYFTVATIPGSKNACIYKTSFEDDVKKIIKNTNDNIIVFGLDKKHEASDEAAKSLMKMGYKNVLIYKDGIEGWKNKGGKLIGSRKYPSLVIKNKNYKINIDDSYLEWEGSNIANRHFGKIQIKSGEIKVSKNKISDGEIILDMNKITCNDLVDKITNGYLISHLKSEDFFDVKKFPVAKIKIKKVKLVSNIHSSLNYSVDSDITIKDVTRSVNFKIHGHFDKGKLIAQGSLVLDRSLWNVKYGSSKFFEWLGMHIVNDQIRLRFKIVAN